MWIAVTRTWISNSGEQSRRTLINVDHIRRIESKGKRSLIYWDRHGLNPMEVLETYERITDLIQGTKTMEQ